MGNHVDNGIMNKEAINEMIERQGVYEIKYQKEEDVKNLHISNIRFSPEFGDSYIVAYCHEADKELTYKISRILSIQDYWIGILSKDATVPNDGTYLIASSYLGQGVDIEYGLFVLKEGDPFIGREDSCFKPIAYHFIPPFGNLEGKWINKEITIKKWEDEIIPAPQKGIPIIAYCEPQKESLSKYLAPVEYYFCCRVFAKNDDISTGFKEWNSAGPWGWSECWDGYRILGYVIVNEYDRFACRHHIEQRLKIEPEFFE